MLRPASPRLAPLVATLALGCGGPTGGGPVARAPEFEPRMQSKCGVQKSQARPLIVEWPSADRATLEALKERGLVAVRYEGCEMELLAQCRVASKYQYTGTTLKRDRVTIKDADELYASVPFGAARLESKLQKAGELNVAMTIVGRYQAERASIAADDLDGVCGRATHVITGLTAGAFEFFAGAAAEAGGGGNILGAGLGARTDTERELLNQDGDPKACEAASTSDGRPPEGCGALLRVEVAPIGAARSRPTLPADGDAPPPAEAARRAPALGPAVVRMHIEADDPAVALYHAGEPLLEEGQIRTELGTLVCKAPCDRVVDGRRGELFYFDGRGFPTSPPFKLADHEGEVTARVETGNRGLVTLGGVFTTLGGLSALVGLPLLIAGAAGSSSSSGDVAVVGGGLLGGGLGGFALGLPLTLSFSTSYEIVPAKPAP